MTSISLGRNIAIAYLIFHCSATLGASADRMDNAVNAHVQDGFMGSVSVAREGEVLLNQGYGQANMEWSVPNAPTTKFRIASITKQFTAVAILMLAERNALNINNRINVYLENLPESWADITIFHLLTHTSGLPESLPLLNFNETLNNYTNVPLDFTPGEQYEYSNFGYIVLGKIIEEASGRSYQDFVKENIFEKLKMTDTGYDVKSKVITSRASGYSWEEGELVNADYDDMSELMAVGGMYSTTEDLHRWIRALFAGELLSDSSLTQMTAAYKDNSGLGVFVQTISGNRKIWHNGSITGFHSFIAYYPDIDATIIVLSNVEGRQAEVVARELEFVLLDMNVVLPSEWIEVSLAEDDLAEFVGTYEFREGLEMKFWVEEGQLFSQATEGEEVLLTPSENMTFYPEFPYERLEFGRSPDGIIDRLEYYQAGQKYTLRRL